MRAAGISKQEVTQYLANVRAFERNDRLSGMPHTLWKLREARNWGYTDPAWQEALTGLIAFHEKYGDENALTDSVNFIKERKRFYQLTGQPESAPISLSDVQARLVNGEAALDRLGKNGPTITGPGITREMQASHRRELSMDMQERNENLRELDGILRRQGAVTFSSLEQIENKAQALHDPPSPSEISKIQQAIASAAGNTFLGKVRAAGISGQEMTQYLADIRVFERNDRLYGMPHTLWKLKDAKEWGYKDPAWQKALAGLIAFHEKFGDKNVLTDSVNFIRERNRFYQLTGQPESAPISLSDVQVRLAKGERNLDQLGKNGPTIMGPGIDREMQGNHFRELSMDMQIRNSNLRELTEILQRQGLVPFADLDQLESAAWGERPEGTVYRPQTPARPEDLREPPPPPGIPKMQEAVETVNGDSDLLSKIAQEVNALTSGARVDPYTVKRELLRELDQFNHYPSDYLKSLSRDGLISIAAARFLLSRGIDSGYGSLNLRKDGNGWEMPDLYNKADSERLKAEARKEKPLTISAGFGHSNADVIGFIDHFNPYVKKVIDQVASRQRLRPGMTLADLEHEMKVAMAGDMMVPIVNSWDRSGQLTYDITAGEVVFEAEKYLSLLRNRYFEPGPSSECSSLGLLARGAATN